MVVFHIPEAVESPLILLRLSRPGQYCCNLWDVGKAVFMLPIGCKDNIREAVSISDKRGVKRKINFGINI